MRSPWILGAAGGAGGAALSIASNLRRADPHLVSFAPDLLGAVVIASLIVWVVRRASRGAEAGRGRQAGRRATVVAAVTCALPMGIFTWQYFANRSLVLAAAVAGMSFVSVNVVGLVATYLALRSNNRLQPTAPGRS